MVDFLQPNGSVLLHNQPEPPDPDPGPGAQLGVRRTGVGTNPLAAIGMFGAGTGNLQGVITLSTMNSGTSTGALVERMRVHTSGSVGIGTTSPLSTLTVGGANASLRITSGNENGYVFENDNADDYKLKLRYKNPTNLYREIATFHYATGNVGIGTTSPLSTLTVGGANASLRITSGNENGYVFENDNADDYKLKLRYKNPTNVYQDIMSFHYANGNVGVGTMRADSKLHVAGDTLVEGSLRVGKKLTVHSADHMVLQREATDGGGRAQLFLDLLQYDTNPPSLAETWPCIRFHHAWRFWRRIEARPDGFHFKNGDLASDDYFNVSAREVWASGHLLPSDRELKRDIEPLGEALDRVRALRAVRFAWKDAARGDDRHIGLVAQEVEEIFPDAVSVGRDGMKGIDYARLVAPLIEAVKELAAEVEALKRARPA